MANNIIDKNYASLVRIPKGAEAGTKRAFTDAEFLTLENGWRNVPGGDAVYALCYLGFRVSEFLQLRPMDYDPIQHTLTGGLKTAAGRNRVVPVHENIIPIIDRWAAGGNEYLYTDGKGHGYKKDRFLRSVWAPAISALGLPSDLTPPLRPPHLRHQALRSRGQAGGHPGHTWSRRVFRYRQHLYQPGCFHPGQIHGPRKIALVTTSSQRLKNPTKQQNKKPPKSRVLPSISVVLVRVTG